MNPIRQYIIRELKESNLYRNYVKGYGEKHKIMLNSIHFFELFKILNEYKCIKTEKLIRLKNKFECFKIIEKPLCILNIKNGDKIEKFLNDNGIVWNSGDIIKELNQYIKSNNGTISIILGNEGRIMCSLSSSTDLINAKKDFYTFMYENDFYDYYNNLREEIFNKFKILTNDITFKNT